MIVVVLPAYNEEHAVPLLIQRLRSVAHTELDQPLCILVVDDGSHDQTAERVRALAGDDLILVQHGRNRGLGEAIKTGLSQAIRLGPDVRVIVTMDADNTHNPDLLPGMVAAIERGTDVVIASRYRKGSQVVGLSKLRELLSLVMSWLFRVLVPVRGVRDYSCGYRAYRAELIRQGFDRWGDELVSRAGFSCMVELLLKLNRLQANMSEVPMVLRYDYKQGASKMKVGKTISETLALAWQERLVRFGWRQ
jgi:dolichol-phosphate mannosyltransferase